MQIQSITEITKQRFLYFEMNTDRTCEEGIFKAPEGIIACMFYVASLATKSWKLTTNVCFQCIQHHSRMPWSSVSMVTLTRITANKATQTDQWPIILLEVSNHVDHHRLHVSWNKIVGGHAILNIESFLT